MPELDNVQHEQFAREYLKDYNATKAGRRAGYKDNYGRDILHYPAIQERIRELRDEISARTEITPERIALEYSRLAFHDARDVAAVLGALSHAHRTGDPDDDKSPEAMIASLPREVTAPIREITARVDLKGNVTYSVKAHDKYRALEVLAERYWTSDEVDDGFVSSIRALREGDVPDMSEATDALDTHAYDSTHNTDVDAGLDDSYNTDDDVDVPKWRKDRGV